MDVPRYADSRASHHFYFTPAAVEGSPGDWSEITKGDNEGYLFRVKAGEILKATQLHFLPPETRFTGLALAVDEEMTFPKRIRLGSFRGVAWLEMDAAESIKAIGGPAPVDHTVDPLVSSPVRGVMLNLFPYPLVQNAVCPKVYELKFQRSTLGSKSRSPGLARRLYRTIPDRALRREARWRFCDLNPYWRTHHDGTPPHCQDTHRSACSWRSGPTPGLSW